MDSLGIRKELRVRYVIKIVQLHIQRRRCIARIPRKQILNELQHEPTGFCGRDRSLGINLVLQ